MVRQGPSTDLVLRQALLEDGHELLAGRRLGVGDGVDGPGGAEPAIGVGEELSVAIASPDDDARRLLPAQPLLLVITTAIQQAKLQIQSRPGPC